MLSHWSSLYQDTTAYPIDTLSENPARLGELFAAYVGVIYQQDGMRVVQTWIDALIKHSASKVSQAPAREATASPAKRAWAATDHISHHDTSPHSYKRPRLETGSPTSPSDAKPSPTFLPASQQMSPSTTPRSAPANAVLPHVPKAQVDPTEGDILPGLSMISVLHQRAAKKGLKQPVWNFSNNGTPHAPEWQATLSSECRLGLGSSSRFLSLNGTCALPVPEIGLVTLGIHKTKQGAKEEAAKSALTGPDAVSFSLFYSFPPSSYL